RFRNRAGISSILEHRRAVGSDLQQCTSPRLLECLRLLEAPADRSNHRVRAGQGKSRNRPAAIQSPDREQKRIFGLSESQRGKPDWPPRPERGAERKLLVKRYWKQ